MARDKHLGAYHCPHEDHCPLGCRGCVPNEEDGTVAMACERCAELQAELDAMTRARDSALVDMQNMEVDLRVMRRLKAKAEAELKRKHDTATREDASRAQEVFDYWVACCRKGSTRVIFGDKRKKAVVARLQEGHTVDDLHEAIDGAACDAYKDQKGVIHDDLELICRDEVMVSKFQRRARAYKRRFVNMPPALVVETLTQVAGDPIHDLVLDTFLFRCPACRTSWDDLLYRPLSVSVNGSVSMECRECGAGMDRIREAVAGA